MLGWQIRSIMVCYDILWSGQLPVAHLVHFRKRIVLVPFTDFGTQIVRIDEGH